MMTLCNFFLVRIFGTDKGYRRLKALKSNEVEVEAGSKQI